MSIETATKEAAKILNKTELINHRLKNNDRATQSQVMNNIVNDPEFRALIQPQAFLTDLDLKTLGLKFGGLMNRAIAKTIQS